MYAALGEPRCKDAKLHRANALWLSSNSDHLHIGSDHYTPTARTTTLSDVHVTDVTYMVNFDERLREEVQQPIVIVESLKQQVEKI